MNNKLLTYFFSSIFFLFSSICVQCYFFEFKLSYNNGNLICVLRIVIKDGNINVKFCDKHEYD